MKTSPFTGPKPASLRLESNLDWMWVMSPRVVGGCVAVNPQPVELLGAPILSHCVSTLFFPP